MSRNHDLGHTALGTACSTCKDRKIACDRTTPVCQNCRRSKRSCQRHRVRLSWPRANDRRRAVVGQQPLRLSLPKGTRSQFEFINAYSEDVEMQEYLLYTDEYYAPKGVRSHTRLAEYLGTYVLVPTVSLPNHAGLAVHELELVPYFFSVVLPCLPAFGIDLESLRSTLTRLALLDDSASSQAVLDSLIAWAHIHKNKNQRQATKFVGKALSSLRVSVQNGISLQRSLQHIVSGILICSLEMRLFSQSSSTWLLYLSGTKAMINQVYQNMVSEDADQTLLFQWVFYYDTIARLGTKHWHGSRSVESQLAKELGFDRGSSRLADYEITRYGGCAHKVLELLSEFCSGMLPPEDPRYRSVEYSAWLGQVEKQLDSIRQELQQQQQQQHTPLPGPGHQSEDVAVKELFVLATLVYCERKSLQLVGSSSKIDKWTEDAFLILSKIKECNKPFPLFVFGLEARTDARRLMVLDIVDRTIGNASSLVSLRRLLLKAWVQHDLNAEEDMPQRRESCVFLRICNFAPCLL